MRVDRPWHFLLLPSLIRFFFSLPLFFLAADFVPFVLPKHKLRKIEVANFTLLLSGH